MPQTTASKMVHGSLDLLRETAENGHQFSTEEVRDLLSGCEIGYRLLEELHSRIQKMLDQGVEGKAIGVLLKELIETLDTGIKSFDAAKERINAALMGIEEKAQAILKIDQLRHQTAENRGKISAILQLLEATRKNLRSLSLPDDTGKPGAPDYLDFDKFMRQIFPGEET